ncbi:MAG TPA: excinuclease ABC subunit UvrA [SAR324 cluster bacterium]|nr:excinuclease ABC subunit UvrA [SAR324 cluster bacterium]
MTGPSDEIVIVGASEHNLKNVNLTLPRNTLTVFTGVSGSGKSSLAFDTIFKEGQRRFVESLSAYARQFLGQTEKPRVEHVEGLSPTISVDQKTVNRNPRSTVGTVTEIFDHYRLLFSRLGEPHCPNCGKPIESQTPEQIADYAYVDGHGETCLILAPMIRERKGEYRKEIEQWAAEGYVRARIDGTIRRLDEEIQLARYEKHTLELVIDRLELNNEEKSRFTEGIEKALRLAEGLVVLEYRGEDHLFSQLMACPACQIALPEMEPRLFSFNAPQGACPTCNGLGQLSVFTEEKLCNPKLSMSDGALRCFTERGNILFTRIDERHMNDLYRQFSINRRTSWKKLPEETRKLVLHGNAEVPLGISNVFRFSGQLRKKIQNGQWPGIIAILQFVYRFAKGPLEKFQETSVCPDCEGRRLNPTALAVRFHEQDIHSLSEASLEEAILFFESIELSVREEKIGRDIFREIKDRLHFLNDVGVGYLNLNRSAATLSGGEAQRIRLASQLGAGLQGVLYVLDEPSIGLHQSDNLKLIETLKKLRDRGNTVLVVEHDEETIESADHIVDVGPVAGLNGGEVTAQGSLHDIVAEKASLTGDFLSGREVIELPKSRRTTSGEKLIVRGARFNNLKDLTVEIPLGLFVCVAGVSGSGKSSLIDGVLKKAVANHLIPQSNQTPGEHDAIEGLQELDRLIEINQTPIGRTPRSNPATYTKMFDPIRDLFALVPESKARGYKKGRFSFNVKGGRCADCQGAGIQTIEMQFLSDVQIPCETCRGRRFNAETLQIFFKGKTIFDVLEMTVDEAAEFFSSQPKIHIILETLKEVGMGYVKLGQPSTTLSGGEAQRIKLAAELRKKSTGKTLYLLDEPTTGLHFHDIRLLLNCLNRLVEQGNTVLVIEHNLDVLKMADHIIELGPGGGNGGGELVCSGPPEKLVKKKTLTGRFLKKPLKGDPPISYQISQSTETDAVLEASVDSKGQNKGKVSKLQNSKINGRDIQIRGASKNNLRHVDLDIPLNQMTVITGVSGSGKTSLAFDTLFAEGQSRYVESLSTYARRFLGRMDKAPVDSIDGLAPAIAINQKSTSRNPRSTVATTTEIYDYLRLLFARIGMAHCPISGQALIGYSPTRAAEYCLEKYNGERLELLAPLFLPGAGKTLLLDQPDHFPAVIESLIHEGFLRAYVKNKLVRLDEWEEGSAPKLKKKSSIDLVIDRIEVSGSEQKRLAEAIENAFQKGHGLLKLKRAGSDSEAEFLSETPACVETGFYQEEALTPRMFSFNSHLGACPSCDGLGELAYRISDPACPECMGERLKPEYRAVTIQGRNISQFCSLNIREAQKELESWVLTPNQLTVAEQALREIQTRLDFLVNVGLDYLSLDQKASTLSGGEAQRIRLASQIGSGLVGVMYVLDEPTIGLHPRDTDRLISTLKRLRDLGNTVILVEHDLDTIRAADHIIDIGPGAGHHGGLITASGNPAQIASRRNTLTGRYLKGEKGIPVPEQRRKALPGNELIIRGASANNLNQVDVRFPLGLMNVVTGVSGSGKSSLVVDVLQRALEKKMLEKRADVGKHKEIKGYDRLEQLMVIDQEPIGRTPRSNPATYTKVMDPIRDLFSKMNEARRRGFTKRRFSFNAREGRCGACEGQGYHLIEMHFLSDVWVTCDQCKGQRYNRETLAVTFRGHSIADVLHLEITKAVELFESQPRILRILKTLDEVGLGYMKLGQPGNTLSGGEAQRLKLAAELSKRSRGKTLYILDEPTTGLHVDDVARLLKILQRLVDQGNTAIIIEHNLEVIKSADWITDLGPEGGAGGGKLLFSGTPEDCVAVKESHTGRFLAAVLQDGSRFPLTPVHVDSGAA